MVERRPGPHGGKAAVVWEETGTYTTRAAGGEGQARRARGAERTSGRSSSQPGLTATGTAPWSAGTPAAAGGLRTDACAHTSDAGGGRPADRVRDIMACQVTPCSCTGALGTGQLQESPDPVGPRNQGAPVEAHQRVQGCLWGSTAASCALGRRPKGGHGQHRPGESPPSGIAGGPAETWTRVE